MVLLVYFIFQQLLLHLQLSPHQKFGVVCIPSAWGKDSKLSLSFRTHRLVFFPDFCRALCCHHPHINPWQWFALSHQHPPCLQQRLEAAPHTAELLSSHSPNPPSQKSSSKPTFIPCAKLQVCFLPPLRLKQGWGGRQSVQEMKQETFGVSHLQLGRRRKEGAGI